MQSPKKSPWKLCCSETLKNKKCSNLLTDKSKRTKFWKIQRLIYLIGGITSSDARFYFKGQSKF